MEWHIWGVDVVLRHPERLFLAFGILLMWLLVFWEAWRRRKVLHKPWLRIHLPVAKLSHLWKRIVWWFLVGLVASFLILASTVPEKIHKEWDRVYGGIRITCIVDSSWSTKGAEDVKPNRFVEVKRICGSVVNMLRHDPELKGRYSLALIPFAGAAQPFFAPFTVSQEDILSSLVEVDENTVSKQGTSFWAALRAYEELIYFYRPQRDEGVLDLAILISDGDKEEGREGEVKFIPEVIRSIQELPLRLMNEGEVKWRMHINSVGVGRVTVDERGKRISVPTALVVRDGAGNFIDYYRQDPKNPQSSPRKSALDEETLKWIARLGGGEYRHYTEREEILSGVKKLVLAHRKVVDEIPQPRYEPVWNWFLIPALILSYFLFGFAGWMLRLLFWFGRVVRGIFSQGRLA